MPDRGVVRKVRFAVEPWGSFGPFGFRRSQYEHAVREAVQDATAG
ncbi:hypothetical protein [Kribbella caucasensis]|nr:hypothetical protein [Kribbella sp. VKM Ac-2527]